MTLPVYIRMRIVRAVERKALFYSQEECGVFELFARADGERLEIARFRDFQPLHEAIRFLLDLRANPEIGERLKTHRRKQRRSYYEHWLRRPVAERANYRRKM